MRPGTRPPVRLIPAGTATLLALGMLFPSPALAASTPAPQQAVAEASEALLTLDASSAWLLAQAPQASGESAMPSVSLPWEQAVLSGLPPRQPWLAAGLSVAITGTGQFYNRDSTKGWILFGTLATYPLAMAIDAWTGSGYARVGAFTLMMAAKGYSAWEAYHTAAASASATP